MTDSTMFDAIEFAARAHRGQLRKGSRLPYVFHPLSVGRILLDAGCGVETVIAGFLHDTVEDTQVTIGEIASLFGERVAFLVTGASEKDKADTWENRKRETLEKLETADVEVVVLSCADKLDNIRSIRSDMKRTGEDVWKRFNRPKEMQKWYYEGLARVLSLRLAGGQYESLAKEYLVTVEEVFGGG